jgi:hypothetical protein
VDIFVQKKSDRYLKVLLWTSSSTRDLSPEVSIIEVSKVALMSTSFEATTVARICLMYSRI